MVNFIRFTLMDNSIASIDVKKVERFEETIKSYHNFVDSFKNSSYYREAENYYLSSLKELEKLKTKSNGI